jgi:L-alanine-DL-glutamate epimerase-like enolase superfamily enzyme
MKSNRRNFLRSAALLGGATTLRPISSCNAKKNNQLPYADYTKLDEALKLPVLKKELFPNPVIIESLELLRDRKNFICRVRSKDGAEGISVGHPFISQESFPLFMNRLHTRFVGQDARDLDNLIFLAHGLNVKRQGVPLCVQIATIEFAILDMLGNIANKPMGQLIGDLHNPEIGIYLGTRISELRQLEPRESLMLLKQDIAESSAKAIKLRAGRGDSLGLNHENAEGRTEKLIHLARKMFGDEMVIMIDGNGTYDLQESIRIGKILEELDYYFYEEPLPWNWYEEQKRVADTLTIPMAGGEEEFSMHAFRWLIANNAFEIIQPDIFYFGGMIRSMQVARMAQAAGKVIVPHMSSGGLGYLYMLQLTSVCENAGKYHEFKMFQTSDANRTIIPIESKTKPFTSEGGNIKAPDGSGLGIIIDPDYIKTHTLVKA